VTYLGPIADPGASTGVCPKFDRALGPRPILRNPRPLVAAEVPSWPGSIPRMPFDSISSAVESRGSARPGACSYRPTRSFPC
jgi:hypothetical protein